MALISVKASGLDIIVTVPVLKPRLVTGHATSGAEATR